MCDADHVKVHTTGENQRELPLAQSDAEMALCAKESHAELQTVVQNTSFAQKLCVSIPSHLERVEGGAVWTQTGHGELLLDRGRKRLWRDKDCSFNLSSSLKRRRTNGQICSFSFEDFSDSIDEGQLHSRRMSGKVSDEHTSGSTAAGSPLLSIFQVDGASDDFDQPPAKERPLNGDNGTRVDVQLPPNPGGSCAAPFFRQFGNACGQSLHSGGARNAANPSEQNTMYLNSSFPRFGPGAASSMFHPNHSAQASGVFGPQRNIPGFPAATGMMPPSQHVYTPPTYPVQKHFGGIRWNLLEHQNSNIPASYSTYSSPFLWHRGTMGCGQEALDHCSWTSYTTQQQQQQQQQQLRSIPHSPERMHSSTIGQHPMPHPLSSQGLELCPDRLLSPGSTSRLLSRKTPVGSSPVERPSSGTFPAEDLVDKMAKLPLSLSAHTEIKTGNTVSLSSSSHPVFHSLKTDQPLKDLLPSSREFSSKTPAAQTSSSKTLHLENSQELVASLPAKLTSSDVKDGPQCSGSSGFSTISLSVPNNEGFENRFHHLSNVKDSSYHPWLQQQHLSAGLPQFPGEERTVESGPGYYQDSAVRKESWKMHPGGYSTGVAFPPAQQFPPSSSSGSVVLTDLLQQHNMMQQHRSTLEQKLPLSSSSFHHVTHSSEALPARSRSDSLKNQLSSTSTANMAAMNYGLDTAVISNPNPNQITSSAILRASKMEVNDWLDVSTSPVVTAITTSGQPLCSSVAVSADVVTCCSLTSEAVLSVKCEALLAQDCDVEVQQSSSKLPSSNACIIPPAKLPGGNASTGIGIDEKVEGYSHQSMPPQMMLSDSDSTSRTCPSVSSQTQSLRDAKTSFAPMATQPKIDVSQGSSSASPACQPSSVSAQHGGLNSQTYGDWLVQRDNSLTEEIRNLEQQVAQHRKTKKSLMAKQRTAQKSGRELSEDDMRRLSETGDEQTRLLQQLYQCRRDARSHQSKVQEFRLKTMGHGILDGQQPTVVEGIQERPLEPVQQIMRGNRVKQPYQCDDIAKHMAPSGEMLHQHFRQDIHGPVPLFPAHSDQPFLHSPIHNHFFPSEGTRKLHFPVPDTCFRPWHMGESAAKFTGSSSSGMMPQDRSGTVRTLVKSGGPLDVGFNDVDRSGTRGWKRLPGEPDAGGKPYPHMDANGRQSHTSAQLSPRVGCDQPRSDSQRFNREINVERQLSEQHMVTGEQERFMTLEKVCLLSAMTESTMPSAKTPSHLAAGGGWSAGHLPGYEFKQNLVQKSLKRAFSDGDKVPRKWLKRLSVDSLSRDELLHPLDFEADLDRMFEQLQKQGPLNLTEPDISVWEAVSPLYTECVSGVYGQLAMSEHDPYAAFDSLLIGHNAASVTCVKQDFTSSAKSHIKEGSFDVEADKWKMPTMVSTPGISSHSKNQVCVTVTLSRSAGNNIASVVSAIADMLKVAVPVKYEIDPSFCVPLAGKKNCHVVQNSRLYEENAVNLQSLVRARTKFCRFCAMPIEYTKVKKEESFDQDKIGCDEDNHDLAFCSVHCSLEFSKAYETATRSNTNLQQPHATGAGSAVCGIDTPGKTAERCSSSLVLGQIGMKEEKLEDQRPKSPCSQLQSWLEPSKEKVSTRDKCRTKIRKWENVSYKRWTAQLTRNRHKQKSAVSDHQDQSESLLHKDNFCGIVTARQVPDLRKCVFCLTAGDATTDGPGRLLNMDFDLWVHVNCALWSSEVYETMDGTLMNVASAYNRGLTLDCVTCGLKGATIACYRTRCTNAYHLECARKDGVSFLENKTCYCCVHSPKVLPAALLKEMSVFRKVVVDREENRQLANVLRHDDLERCRMRIGSLVIHNIGQLLPCQIQSGSFNSEEHLYPVGFKSCRYYWSYRQIHSRCRYICKIVDVDGKPDFVIKVKESGKDDVIFRDSSCTGAWFQILKPVEQLRHSKVLTSFFTDYIRGEDLFGLSEPVIQRVIESLPGVELLNKFKFRFGKSSLYVFPLAINPTGCIRSEPKTKTFFKRSHTLLSSFKVHSSSSGSALLGSGEFNIQQYMKQFTHTKPQRYRSLKMEWRNNVYLRRSNIQGLGLFAARQLEQYTMVIEYIGQLIRNELCEIREKIYEQQNRGIYMFRIDENTVIDATMAGGPARYINHSCDPNCFTEIISTERGNKIVITALRKINSGEELTYDYKFDLEDDKKIPCLCGASKCQKWMN